MKVHNCPKFHRFEKNKKNQYTKNVFIHALLDCVKCYRIFSCHVCICLNIAFNYNK